ncbi:hypothetical protein P3G55_26045 [Leptospira sp. 96542]|nr:hypothetical protein [Leptospira sp. 96542]
MKLLDLPASFGRSSGMRIVFHSLPLVLLPLGMPQAQARDVPTESIAAPSSSEEDAAAAPWTFTVAPYVHHWRKNPDHRHAFIFSLEKEQEAHQLLGLALFRNSFGQPSAYAYVGQEWQDFLETPRLTAKLTAGIIYGYKGEYADKVPLNRNGYSPGLIPALGYQMTERDSVQFMVLGNAGYTLGYSRSF